MNKLLLNELYPNISKDMLEKAMCERPSEHVLIGQVRAKDALHFGLEIDAKGYNIFVMGEQASGRFTLVKDQILNFSNPQIEQFDLCYLNNFDDERQPKALKLRANQSKLLVERIEAMIDEIIDTFPAVFDNPSFLRQKSAVIRENELLYDKALQNVEEYALSKGVALIENEGDISFSPIVDKNIISDNELSALTDEQKSMFFNHIEDLEVALNEALIEVPNWQRQTAERLRQLKRKTVEQAIRPLLKTLEHEYSSELGVLRYFKRLKPHLIDTVIDLFASDATKDEKTEDYDKRSILVETYVPNVLVMQSLNGRQPVVYEENPSYQNLFGKIEYTSVQGSVYTNYRMLVAGALHKANGGYLLIEADKLIEQPYAWEALKLALKSGQLKMNIPNQELGMTNSITQTPEAVDLNVKLILLGSRELYYALQNYDDEFNELVRVLVDFDKEIEFNQSNLNDFYSALTSHAQNTGFREVTMSALQCLVQFSFRQAEHQNKLSAHFAEVIELIHEAFYFAKKENSQVLDSPFIETALSAKRNRSGRASESLFEEIKEGHLLIETKGSEVGKVNGLTVMEIGGTAFGTPARITATVYAGASGVIDIEREVELGQSIHSKGVLLLTGYLGNKYAHDFPLTLSANIALEQSYGYIDGDSASLGELIALISALTNLPIKQSIAITGSINQYGEVQAVGGINEKIEGFYQLCKIKGLDANQGVIIPKSNRINLVLSDEIRNAVAQEQFSVYAVDSVDQAIQLMMNKKAGTLNSVGRYTRGSVHAIAVERLFRISQVVNGSSEEG